MKLPIWLLIIVVVFYSGCAKEAELNEVNKVSIISIAPSSGPAGTTVVIKGANFGADLSDNVVRFNNDSAAVLAASVDSLVVIAPAKGTSGPVTVAVAGSIATGPVFTYTIDSLDVYVSAPASGVVYWKTGRRFILNRPRIISAEPMVLLYQILTCMLAAIPISAHIRVFGRLTGRTG